MGSYGYGPVIGRDSTDTGMIWGEVCISHIGTGWVMVDSSWVGYRPGCHFHTRAADAT